jgi:ATP-dependent DNA ligase
MRLKRAKPFDSPDHIFELKHDGFRCIAYIDNGSAAKVRSRTMRMGPPS